MAGGVGVAGAVTGSNTDTDNTTGFSSKSSETFSSKSFGAADSGRTIYVAIMAGHSDTITDEVVSSVTIGGVSASVVKRSNHDNSGNFPFEACIWKAAVPTGTTGDVVVNYNNAPSNAVGMAISIYRVLGESGTLYDFATDTASSLTLDVDTVVNGFVIACAATQNGTALSWSGVTEDIGVDVNTNEYFSAGSLSVTSASTPLAVSPSAGGSAARAGVSISLQPA